MAVRIPTYESRLTPSGQGIQARASAVNVSDAIGRGLQNLGQAIGTVTESYAKDVNEAKVREADNKISDSIRGILYNPESGYLTKVGKDAVDSAGDIEKKIRDLQEQVGGTLGSKEQRRMFDDVFNRRLESALGNVTSHAAQQAKVYNVGEAKARTEMAIQDGISNYANADAFTMARATALQESVYGLSGAQAEVAARSALTKLHTGVISQMLAQDRPALARDWFANNSHEIDPTQHEAIIKALQAGSLKEDSLNLSFELQAKSSDYTSQEKSLKELFQSGKISAEVYDATKTRLDANYSEQQEKINKYKTVVIGQAQDWILKNPGRPIIEMPSSLYNSAKTTGSLASLDALAQREGKPAERTKELQVRGQLLQLASQDPESFIKKFNETGFTGETDIGISGIKEMQNMATAMIQGKGSYANGFDSKILQDAIPAALLKTSAKDQKDAFVALQAEAIANWKKNNPGKLPTIEEQKRVAQEANTSWIEIGKYWNNADIPGYKVKSKSLTNVVPTNFYNGMKNAGATDDEILAAWNIKQGKK